MIDLRNDKNIDAEYGVVGALLLDSGEYGKIAGRVFAEDFTITLCGKLYAAAERNISEGKPWDMVVASGEVGGDKEIRAFVGDVMTVVMTTANIKLHAEIVHKCAQMRELKRAVDEAATESKDPQELAATVTGICRDFLSENTSKKLTTISAAIDKVYKNQTTKDAGGRINTGFPMVDSILKGMMPGNLVIIGARPGVGKTAFALDIAQTAARVGRVLIYSYEMDDDEIAERMIARAGEIELDAFIEKSLTAEQMKVFGATASYLGKFPININSNPTTKLANIRNEARLFDDLKLIVVDYLTLMPPESKKDRRDLEIAELTRGMKILAKELNVPIILLAQLNRNTDSETEPDLRDLRESGAIEQDANKVILLWLADKTNSVIGVKIAKNRRGKLGKAFMEFAGEYMSYTELSGYKQSKKKKRSIYEDDMEDD